jgi:hypothetical protein
MRKVYGNVGVPATVLMSLNVLVGGASSKNGLSWVTRSTKEEVASAPVTSRTVIVIVAVP